MITRESVEALRKHLDRWPPKSVPFYDEQWSITVAELRALCDHYLSTPAAEPTAGDARKAAEAVVTRWRSGMSTGGGVKTVSYNDLINDIERAIVAAQRQARPSLGECDHEWDSEPCSGPMEPQEYEVVCQKCGLPMSEWPGNGEQIARPSLGAAADGKGKTPQVATHGGPTSPTLSTALRPIGDEQQTIQQTMGSRQQEDTRTSNPADAGSSPAEPANTDATLAEIEKRWEAATPDQSFSQRQRALHARQAAAPTDVRYLLAEVRRLREMAMAERERCAKLVPTTWLDPMFHADDTPPLDGLSVEWVCKRIAAAIRASSTTGSPDGSPEGEGGRETT